MRIKAVLWAIGIGLVVGFYLAGSSLLKGWVEQAFSQACQRKVTVQAANLSFPIGIRLTGIAAPSGPGQRGGPLGSIQEAGVRLSLLAMLKGKPGLELELIGPKLSIERTPEGLMGFPLALGTPPNAASRQQVIPLGRLRIQGGEVTFVDRMVSPEVTWVLRDLGMSLGPGSRRDEYAYNGTALLVDASKGPLGKLEVNGEWIPPVTAEAKVSIRIDRLQVLSPYVRQVLGTAPSQGACAVVSDVSYQEGRIIADTKLTARDLIFPTDEPTLLGPTGNKLAALLKDREGVIHLSFVVTGTLGERLNWSDLMTAALREAMKQALTRSIQRTLTEVEQKPIEELIRKGLESLGR